MIVSARCSAGFSIPVCFEGRVALGKQATNFLAEIRAI